MDHDVDKGANCAQAPLLNAEQLEAILRFDTCTIANAIERFGLRLRNEGFTRPGISCVTGSDQRVIGYAATFKIKTADPPVTGGRFCDRTDWWNDIKSLPSPRIAVFENINGDSKSGAVVGEVHTAILKAFGCCGVITDGSVRDVAGIEKLGIPAFATSVAVSHAYMHIVDFGKPIEILGLTVRQGDLLFADRHGVLTIPAEIASEVAEVADRLHRADKRIVDFCQSAEFTPDKLLNLIHESDPCK